MARRQIREEDVARVLAAPEQTEAARAGRMICQARLEMGDPPRLYLLRVFVEVDREPFVVVTVYRTSQIGRYWRKDA